MRCFIPILFFVTTSLQAQSWCPPGAQWKLTIGPSLSTGHLVRTYSGDTIIGGVTAHRIETSGYQVYNGDTLTIQYSDLTSLQGQTVFIWTETFFLPTPQWDTLMRYDAQIGDRWFPPGADFYCAPGSIQGIMQVQDTGHIVVDGHTLRYWDLAYLDYFGMIDYYCGRYYERLGFPGSIALGGSCVVVDYGENLNCYSDFELSYLNTQSPGECDITLSADQMNVAAGPSLFPNPGTTHFTLQLPGGMHTIAVFDATGRSVLSERTADTNVCIDTEALPSGAYVVHVTDALGAIGRGTWMKE